MSSFPDDAVRDLHLNGPATLQVTKGHGTQNDFVLIDDRLNDLELTDDLVRALANRHSGVGGDGVIRLAPTAAIDPALAMTQPEAHWFMDYRNADGSIAQMCGNGVRVFAAFAENLGLHDFSAPLVVGTRAGVKSVVKESNGWFSVDMGPGTFPRLDDTAHLKLAERGAVARDDAKVTTPGLGLHPRPALSVDMGNPHTVVSLADEAELAAADLTQPPAVTPIPQHGTNVEYVVRLADAQEGVGRAMMRVHERGVGETQSCGTGACAVALALQAWGGQGAPAVWLIDVPGGTVRVSELDNGNVELSGPAVLLAEAVVDLEALI